jgi:hypothetical protein
MAEAKEPQIVVIDNVEYDVNNFTEEQGLLFNHCVDLDRKIVNTTFQLQQLNVGKESFIKLLKAALEPKEE